ncbi:3-isopropylmalate dehydrogenase [SAR202 cluster bacterium AC-647-N09_OGT_505m]|nr:3-isopropylmalate dehydrogenase [SAR202 cluster bacterium AC-647-N09_OGT_505m]
MQFNIALLPGDGVGPEVVAEGVRALKRVEELTDATFNLEYGQVGGIAIDEKGTPLPNEALELARRSDAILFGAVGGPKWDNPLAPHRPEDAILGLRKALGFFANLRPVKVIPALLNSSSVKPSVLEGVDMLVVRELTGGLYFARPKKRWQTSRGRRGVDTLRYTEAEIERVLRVGFELARRRRKKLTSVDKANVLESSRLWREIAIELSGQYPDVELEHMLVDSCAMALVRTPIRFDVLVAENLFGDILTDEAAILAGSLGMLPSSSLAGIPREDTGGHRRTLGLYEPIHGSAPDIAGQGKANPIATILSVALMLRYSLGHPNAASALEAAVESVLNQGYRTQDIAEEGSRDVLTTAEMGQRIVSDMRL